MKKEIIAAICHEANKKWCEMNGDNTQPTWEEAPKWQIDSAILGVEFCLANPDAPASANHESWLKQKLSDGWVYGVVKDAEKKIHPCICDFVELSEFQQKKDLLFKAIVGALK